MASPLDRMNLREYAEIVVLNAPYRLEPDLAMLRGVGIIREIKVVQSFRFLLAFVTRRTEVDALAAAVALKAESDAVVWIAFPKRTSPLYLSELSKDQGWEALSIAGFEADDELAVDPEWNALRFRRGARKGKFARPSAGRPSSAGEGGRAFGRRKPDTGKSGAAVSRRGTRGEAGARVKIKTKTKTKTGKTRIPAAVRGTDGRKSKIRRARAGRKTAPKAAPRKERTAKARVGIKTASRKDRPARKAAVRGSKSASSIRGSGKSRKG